MEKPRQKNDQPMPVIAEYTLDEAMADGVLHQVGRASNGKPLIATAGTAAELTGSEIADLFVRFFVWQRQVEPTLPEAERLFAVDTSNGKKVWVIEDGAAVTLLYPDEY